jgi:hypothetical protein
MSKTIGNIAKFIEDGKIFSLEFWENIIIFSYINLKMIWSGKSLNSVYVYEMDWCDKELNINKIAEDKGFLL